MRERKSQYPELEKRLLDRIQSRQKYGLYRTIQSVQYLAKDIAEELGIQGFTASRNFIYGFIKRSNLKTSYATTDKQQCIWSFLAAWHKWIRDIRKLAQTIGIVSSRTGYIDSYHVWNADEFAIQAHDKNMLQISNRNARMVNTQQLKMTYSTTKRYCTVTAIIPKSGFAPRGNKLC